MGKQGRKRNVRLHKILTLKALDFRLSAIVPCLQILFTFNNYGLHPIFYYGCKPFFYTIESPSDFNISPISFSPSSVLKVTVLEAKLEAK